MGNSDNTTLRIKYAVAVGSVIAGIVASKLSMIDQLAQYEGLEYGFLGIAVITVIIIIKMFDKPSSSQFTTERLREKM